jgi:Fe2+ transport system protein B
MTMQAIGFLLLILLSGCSVAALMQTDSLDKRLNQPGKPNPRR